MELEESMSQVGGKPRTLSPVIFSVVGVEVFHYDRRQYVQHRDRLDAVSLTGVLDNDMTQDGNGMNLGDPSDSFRHEEYVVTSLKGRGAADGLVEVLHTDSTLRRRKDLYMGKRCAVVRQVKRRLERHSEVALMAFDKLNLIAAKAAQDRGLKFSSLAHHVNVENLGRCYKELKRDKACGIDGVTAEAYGQNLQENLERLVCRMKDKSYRPQPVRRVYIPKPGKGEKRGLEYLVWRISWSVFV